MFNALNYLMWNYQFSDIIAKNYQFKSLFYLISVIVFDFFVLISVFVAVTLLRKIAAVLLAAT